MHEVLFRQVANIWGSKQGTIRTAYLFDLYNDNQLLTKPEQKILKTNTNYVTYGIQAPRGSEQKEEEDFDDSIPLTRSKKRKFVLGSQPVQTHLESIDLSDKLKETPEPV